MIWYGMVYVKRPTQIGSNEYQNGFLLDVYIKNVHSNSKRKFQYLLVIPMRSDVVWSELDICPFC